MPATVLVSLEGPGSPRLGDLQAAACGTRCSAGEEARWLVLTRRGHPQEVPRKPQEEKVLFFPPASQSFSRAPCGQSKSQRKIGTERPRPSITKQSAEEKLDWRDNRFTSGT